MQIVRPTLWGRTRGISPAANASSNRRTVCVVRVAAGLLAGAGILLVFASGIVNLQWYGRERLYPALQNAATWLASMPVNPRQLRIDIKYRDYQKLAHYREQALAYGLLVQHEDSYVPAVIQLPDRRVRASVRLKGGAIDHLEGQKWSLRVKIADHDAVFGMTFFSIQDPTRSSFSYEWVFHEIMRREGLVAPRYDFIDVIMNGRPMGIYALEESFSKELLEAHGRREGPIIRFSERSWIDQDRSHRQTDILFASEVDAFQSAKTQRRPELRRQFEAARHLLTGFRNQALSVSEVFDLTKTATYFSLIDLCNGSHACRWKNIRFYYNPITSLLEPIPYNAYSARSAGGARVAPSPWLSGQFVYSPFHVQAWMDAFFRDPAFYDAYVQSLARISTPEYVRQLLADIADPLAEKLRVIHKDYPEFDHNNEYIQNGANLIRNAVRPKFTVRATCNPIEASSGIPRIAIANTVRLAVSLVKLVDTETEDQFDFPDEVQLAPKTMDVPHEVLLPVPSSAVNAFREFREERFELHYRVNGMATIHVTPIRTAIGTETISPAQLTTVDAQRFRRTEMLTVNDAGATIEIRPGTWNVEDTIVIPRGYRVVAGSGVRIQLLAGASLISFSPVAFHGTETQPITISSADGHGRGLAVLSATTESHFSHVRFEALDEPSMGHWSVTGGVTLYESPASFDHCLFLGGRSEDQLNVIRSDFLIQDCEFDSAASDALDVDFGKGEIRDCSFHRARNDAVDVSGTIAQISGCTIVGAGDKAVSAGESSRIALRNCSIRGGRFGLVSKDLSVVTADQVQIADTVTALSAYQKKPEFGPASIHFQGSAPATPVLIEKGSWITSNGRREDGRRLRVARQLYDGQDDG